MQQQGQKYQFSYKMENKNICFSLIIIFSLIVFNFYQNVKFNYQINNVCDNWFSYYNFYFSTHCHYNPDAGKSVGEIIQRMIGVSEYHEVPTEDGFILGVFRMPRKNAKGVILFQHPLSVDSRIWFIQENISTALLFWNAGYDIWLANNRGTTYSQKHLRLTPNQKEFWDYSFHEIGYYDHPACTSYIKKVTNSSKIIFFGHSMSTTTSLIYASLRPEQASADVKVFINLSPTALFNYTTSPFKYLGISIPYFKTWYHRSILAQNSAEVYLFQSFFSTGPFKYLYVYLMTWLFGGSMKEFDPKLIESLLSQFGSEVSMKTLEHYFQLIEDNRFQMYNYGKKLNLQIYGSSQPDLYPIENISTPFYFVYSTADSLVNFKDVEVLYERLSSQAKIYKKKKIGVLNHIDFQTGKHRNVLVYKPLIKFVDKLYK